MKHWRLSLSTATLCASVFTFPVFGAAPSYTFKEVVLCNVAQCYAINNSAQITGFRYASDGTSPAILISGGQMRDLNMPDTDAFGYGINDWGQVVGTAFSATGPRGAFIYTRGSATFLGNRTAWFINNWGQVVGDQLLPNGEVHAVLYSGGQTKDLGTLGGPTSCAFCINELGQVVGYADTSEGSYAFLYSGGMMKSLGALGGHQSVALHINLWGQVVGYADLATEDGDVPVYHAFLYFGGVMKDLGTLGTLSTATGINNFGVITGGSEMLDLSYRAFVFVDGTLYDVNDLVVDAVGWQFEYGLSINDRGQILCRAAGPDGYDRTVVLTPWRGRR